MLGLLLRLRVLRLLYMVRLLHTLNLLRMLRRKHVLRLRHILYILEQLDTLHLLPMLRLLRKLRLLPMHHYAAAMIRLLRRILRLPSLLVLPRCVDKAGLLDTCQMLSLGRLRSISDHPNTHGCHLRQLELLLCNFHRTCCCLRLPVASRQILLGLIVFVLGDLELRPKRCVLLLKVAKLLLS